MASRPLFFAVTDENVKVATRASCIIMTFSLRRRLIASSLVSRIVILMRSDVMLDLLVRNVWDLDTDYCNKPGESGDEQGRVGPVVLSRWEAVRALECQS